MRLRPSAALPCILALAAAGCSPEVEEPSVGAALGFVDIGAVAYELRDYDTGAELPLTSSSARFWYVLSPADDDADNKPLFVMFNGGPGASSAMLQCYGTGARTIDEEQRLIVDNPNSWTQLGSVLYIDARQSGYSYSVVDSPDSLAARQDAFTTRNFNELIDAADVVRVLLRVLETTPALQDNPVVLVGESYGALRATLMLDMLLRPERLGGGGPLLDVALEAQVRTHFAKVFPDEALTPELVARQFGRQVLLQPAISSHQFGIARTLLEDPNSELQQLAVEQGASCAPCTAQELGRERFDFRQNDGWVGNLTGLAAGVVTDLAALQVLSGADAAGVDGLSSDTRVGAYRFVDELDSDGMPEVPDDPAALVASLGALPAWDRYYVGFSFGVLDTFATSPTAYDRHPEHGEALLSNLRWVDTLITNARYDTAIVGESLVQALAQYPSWVSEVAVDNAPRAGLARPGWITLRYADGVAVGDAVRTVRFPRYDDSGHFVTVSQPDALYQDVAALLGE